MKNKDDRPSAENKWSKAAADFFDAHKIKIFAAAVTVFFASCIIPVIAGRVSRTVPVYMSATASESTVYRLWEDDESEDTKSSEEKETEPVSTLEQVSESTPFTVEFPLDINIATVEELMMVKGIGEVLAQRIVDYRNLNGYYYSLEDLLNVEGIGKKKLSSFNGYICINYAALPETLPAFSETVQTEAAAVSGVITVTTAPPKNDASEMKTSVVLSEPEEEYDNIFEYYIGDEDECYDTGSITTQYYPDFPLELNSAVVKDLTYINGIGESTAEKIVEYARTVGFTSVDDLINVKGIGSAKLEDIRPYVYVDPNSVRYPQTTQPQYTFPFYETNDDIFTSQPFAQTVTQPAAQTVSRVNVNTCGKSELMQLPGITEELADKIIGLRDQIGYFVRTEELALVLSDGQLAKIMDYIYV